MLSMDYLVVISMTIVLISGIYQFYFWCERKHIRPCRSLLTFLDSWFSCHPSWIWIYAGLYYPVIILATLTLKDTRHFAYTTFSYIVLMLLQMIFFLLFPVETPVQWRKQVSGNSISERFLRLVHKADTDSNCFPSMHVSVAMLTSLHLTANVPKLGLWTLLFPLLIALSTLYTKRHYFLDTVPGAILGWIVFRIYNLIY
ncbi:phosphatase PAP2 family protein [Candidatus Woesearchaeota archaeon]|nr:phosphatase PAP2 family protein [Candidatus Woesearchaeota archaeon]